MVLFLAILLLQPETVTFPAHPLNRFVCAFRSSANFTVLAISWTLLCSQIPAPPQHNLYNNLAPDYVRTSQHLHNLYNIRGAAHCACTSFVYRKDAGERSPALWACVIARRGASCVHGLARALRAADSGVDLSWTDSRQMRQAVSHPLQRHPTARLARTSHICSPCMP